jgi:hypothetical protein
MSAGDRALLDAALGREAAGGLSTDPADPLGRLELAVSSAGADGPVPDVCRERASAALAAVRAGRTIAWREFTADLHALGVEAGDWDLAVVGSVCVLCDEPGHPKSIDNPEPGIWDGNDERIEA